jgi:Ca2+-binding EF-hand superfamily protein
MPKFRHKTLRDWATSKTRSDGRYRFVYTISARGHHDLGCSLVFVLYMLGMFLICLYGLQNGQPERLLYATDHAGVVCGTGVHADKRLIYYPAASTEFDWKGICVDKCPSRDDTFSLKGKKYTVRFAQTELFYRCIDTHDSYIINVGQCTGFVANATDGATTAAPASTVTTAAPAAAGTTAAPAAVLARLANMTAADVFSFADGDGDGLLNSSEFKAFRDFGLRTTGDGGRQLEISPAALLSPLPTGLSAPRDVDRADLLDADADLQKGLDAGGKLSPAEFAAWWARGRDGHTRWGTAGNRGGIQGGDAQGRSRPQLRGQKTHNERDMDVDADTDWDSDFDSDWSSYRAGFMGEFQADRGGGLDDWQQADEGASTGRRLSLRHLAGLGLGLGLGLAPKDVNTTASLSEWFTVVERGSLALASPVTSSVGVWPSRALAAEAQHFGMYGCADYVCRYPKAEGGCAADAGASADAAAAAAAAEAGLPACVAERCDAQSAFLAVSCASPRRPWDPDMVPEAAVRAQCITAVREAYPRCGDIAFGTAEVSSAPLEEHPLYSQMLTGGALAARTLALAGRLLPSFLCSAVLLPLFLTLVFGMLASKMRGGCLGRLFLRLLVCLVWVALAAMVISLIGLYYVSTGGKLFWATEADILAAAGDGGSLSTLVGSISSGENVAAAVHAAMDSASVDAAASASANSASSAATAAPNAVSPTAGFYYTGGWGGAVTRSRVLGVAACIGTLLLVLFTTLLATFWRTMETAILIMGHVAKVVTSRPAMVVWPFISLATYTAAVSFWLMSTIAILTARDMRSVVEDAGVASISLDKFSFDAALIGYVTFGWFWLTNVVEAVEHSTLAGVVTEWYWEGVWPGTGTDDPAMGKEEEAQDIRQRDGLELANNKIESLARDHGGDDGSSHEDDDELKSDGDDVDGDDNDGSGVRQRAGTGLYPTASVRKRNTSGAGMGLYTGVDEDEREDERPASVCGSFGVVMCNSFGSLAYGSLVLGVLDLVFCTMQLAAAIVSKVSGRLQSLPGISEASDATQGHLAIKGAKLVLGLIECLVKLAKDVVDFGTYNSYVAIAMVGSGLWDGVRFASQLVMEKKALYLALSVAARSLSSVSAALVAVVTGFVCHSSSQHMGGAPEWLLRPSTAQYIAAADPVLVALVVAVSALVVARHAFSIYHVGATSLYMCFTADAVVNPHYRVLVRKALYEQFHISPSQETLQGRMALWQLCHQPESAITNERLREVFKQEAGASNGKLDLGGFKGALKKLLPRRGGAEGAELEQEVLKHFFDAVDADGDGHITVREFRRYLRELRTQWEIFNRVPNIRKYLDNAATAGRDDAMAQDEAAKADLDSWNDYLAQRKEPEPLSDLQQAAQKKAVVGRQKSGKKFSHNSWGRPRFNCWDWVWGGHWCGGGGAGGGGSSGAGEGERHSNNC